VLQRDKVELQMPEMYHKIGNHHDAGRHCAVNVTQINVKQFRSRLMVGIVTLAKAISHGYVGNIFVVVVLVILLWYTDVVLANCASFRWPTRLRRVFGT